MEIILFATNITSDQHINIVAPALNSLHGVERWKVDIDDCDKVLRVVATTSISTQIRIVLNKHGFTCMQMTIPASLTDPEERSLD